MKMPYKNLHSFVKKTVLQLIFILSTFLSSCYDDRQNLIETKSDTEQGFEFGDNKQSQKFYQKTDFDLANVFHEPIHCTETLPQCRFEPSSTRNVKDIFLNCLVPGFKIRNIDPYSPIVAQILKDVVINNFDSKKVCVETKIFTRWGNFSFDNKDNETFETQYFILRNQLDLHIKNLRRIYGEQPRIHVIFIGESYGGKISLFFLDQLLENFTEPNVSFDCLVTIHSPLHPMQMSSYALSSKFLFSPIAKTLTGCLSALDYLNVADYKTTLQILSSEFINYVTTIQALENLQRRNIKIFNFIGTPNEIHLDDTVITFDNFAKNCLKSLQLINTGLMLTFQPRIGEADTLLKFLNDPDYVQNSDFIVKTSEITKDARLIETVKRRRDVLGIYEVENMIFVSTPNLIHLGNVFNLERFASDVNTEKLRARFASSLK